jgi:ribokinase
MDEMTILSIGSVNADFQVRVEERPGSTETLLAHDFVRLSGGKAANIAFLARRLGLPATLIGRIGDDELAEQALGPLREIGVDLAHVRAVPGASTGLSMIMVPPEGKKQIVLATNANDGWTHDDIADVQAAIAAAARGSVLVVDYEVTPFAAAAAIEAARRQGCKVVLDPSFPDRVDEEILAQVDYIAPNASEAQALTGITIDGPDTAIEAARRLAKRGVAHVCVKLEDGGCVVVDRTTTLYVPPLEVEVVDSTGAGDAFTGALAVAILEGRSLRDAACFAAAASHHCVTGYGSQPSYPSRDQINELVPRLAGQIDVR